MKCIALEENIQEKNVILLIVHLKMLLEQMFSLRITMKLFKLQFSYMLLVTENEIFLSIYIAT